MDGGKDRTEVKSMMYLVLLKQDLLKCMYGLKSERELRSLLVFIGTGKTTGLFLYNKINNLT